MKKLILFALTAFIVMMSFNSCGEVDSVYSESWFDKRGYITYKHDPFEGDVLDTFTVDEPAAEVVSEYAVIYKHRYLKTPSCCFYIQQWVENAKKEKLGYETIKTYRFTITSEPQEVGGFWFYCDEENVYVINRLYNDGFTNKKASVSPVAEKNYRFRIDISGITDLNIEMVESQKKHPWDD